MLELLESTGLPPLVSGMVLEEDAARRLGDALAQTVMVRARARTAAAAMRMPACHPVSAPMPLCHTCTGLHMGRLGRGLAREGGAPHVRAMPWLLQQLRVLRPHAGRQ